MVLIPRGCPSGCRRRAGKADGESAVLATITAMPEPDRTLGERLHAIIKANAPTLASRLWYGMPAYAKDGKVLCFFQSAKKFKTRYATFGFMPSTKGLPKLISKQSGSPRVV
jgi:hypothetical protein